MKKLLIVLSLGILGAVSFASTTTVEKTSAEVYKEQQAENNINRGIPKERLQLNGAERGMSNYK